MGQYEEPPPKVRRARFSRSEDAREDRVTQAAKVSGDVPKSQGDVAADVFEEGPARADLVDDPRDVGPEVARIGGAASMSRLAEGLTGVAGRDEIHAAAPRSAVKGSEIVPDSRRSQGLVFHPGHKRGRSVGFPLDVTHSPIAGFGDMDAEVETAVAGAEGDSPDRGRGVRMGT